MQILVEYLRKKVTRLVSANDFRESLTVVRLLAKDGLMEDGKETLLEGELYLRIHCTPSLTLFQPDVLKLPVI